MISFVIGLVWGSAITLFICKRYFDEFVAGLPTKEDIERLEKKLALALRPAQHVP